MMEQIDDKINEKGFQIAYGMTEYKPGMDFEQQLRISDSKMYENKAKFKNSNS